MHTLLLDLPEEILYSILAFSSPNTLSNVQCSCRQLALVSAHPLLWKSLCQNVYRHWRPEIQHQLNVTQPADSTHWQGLFIGRVKLDKQLLRTLDAAISSETNRSVRINEIVRHGLDAKDLLLRQRKVSDHCPDVLARRYWSNEILGCIHRFQAFAEWEKIKNSRNEEDIYSLERCLAAIDLFVAEEPPESFDNITKHLDNVAAAFKIAHPDHRSYSLRITACAILKFLHSENFLSVSPESYGKLQNQLITVALCDAEHPSISLISTTIFCAVARRLGLTTSPCNTPSHVYATVTSPPGYTLNSTQQDIQIAALGSSNSESDAMWLDPFNCSTEIPRHLLEPVLRSFHIPNASHDQALGPASTSDLLRRAARNLRNSVHASGFAYTNVLDNPTTSYLPSALYTHGIQPTVIHPFRAAYCYKNILLYFGEQDDEDHLNGALMPHPLQRLQSLQEVSSDFQTGFNIDGELLARYIQPLFVPESSPENFLVHVMNEGRSPTIITDVRRRHLARPSEDGTPNDNVPDVLYHVGDLFRHARYGYQAAIVGWDNACNAAESWITQMRIDALPLGRTQPFYHVLAEDQSTRYVAQENIHRVGRREHGDVADLGRDAAHPSEGLLRVAGKAFLRWDAREQRFVSNVRESYPDD